MNIRSLCVLLMVGCGGSHEKLAIEVVRSDSVGVEIVVSNGPDLPVVASAERLFVIGGEDEGLGSLFRIAETGLDTGPQGELIVLDPGNYRVVVFDSEGTPLHSFGRAGEGPGEFQIPSSLLVDEMGRVHVFDLGRRTQSVFGIDGTLLEERAAPARFFGGLTRPVWGGIAYGSFDGSRTEWELRLAAEDSISVVRALDAPAPRPVDYESCGIRLPLPPIFSRSPVWDAGSGSVAVARPPGYDVETRWGVTSERRVRRSIEPRAPTPEDVTAHLGEGETWTIGGSQDCVVPPDEAIEQRGVSDWLPVVWGLRLVPGGGMWVQRFDPDDAHPIDVFDPEGAYVGTLPSGFPWPGVFLSEDRFAVVETDEFGVQRILVYEYLISS